MKHSYNTNLHKYHIRFRKFGKENPAARQVNQYDLEGNFIKTWDTIKEASIKLKIKPYNITNCCKNRQKTAGEYKWEYKKKEGD